MARATHYEQVVADGYLKFKDIATGENAKYIPVLANVPSDLFGVALATASGEVWSAGDCDVPFALQSVSKPFTAASVHRTGGFGAVPLGQNRRCKYGISLQLNTCDTILWLSIS